MNEVAPYHVGIQFLLYLYFNKSFREVTSYFTLSAALTFILHTPIAKNDGSRYFTTFKSIELFPYLHSVHDLVGISSSF